MKSESKNAWAAPCFASQHHTAVLHARSLGQHNPHVLQKDIDLLQMMFVATLLMYTQVRTKELDMVSPLPVSSANVHAPESWALQAGRQSV